VRRGRVNGLFYLLIPLSLPQVFSHEVTVEKPEYDTILADGLNLLQLAHPKAVSVLQLKLHNLEQGWLDHSGHIGQLLQKQLM